MAVGDRLKEGVAINQSLACLGNCISALAEKSAEKNIRGNKFDYYKYKNNHNIYHKIT